MFLEPIYLHESMLLNCASYLFGEVVLNKEKTTQASNDANSKGNLSGGGELGVNLFSNMVHANTDITLEHDRKNSSATETRFASQIALGAIHQSVIEKLEEKKFIVDFDDNWSDKYVKDNRYVRLKANLVPVDYFASLQILKMIVPQLENLFELFGASLLDEKKYKDKRIFNEKKKNIVNSFSLVSSLVDQLEEAYLQSNQLEMLIIDEVNKNTIGVIDIDIASQNPNEVKAKLTDGNFVIVGKITKFVNEGESIDLLQRSLLSSIIEKLEIILRFFDEKSKNPDEKSYGQWLGYKTSIKGLLDKLFLNEINGKAFRMKAMSVCV